MTIIDGGRILFWLIVFSTSYNVDSKTLSEGIEAFETMKTLVLQSIPKSIKSDEIFFIWLTPIYIIILPLLPTIFFRSSKIELFFILLCPVIKLQTSFWLKKEILDFFMAGCDDVIPEKTLYFILYSIIVDITL